MRTVLSFTESLQRGSPELIFVGIVAITILVLSALLARGDFLVHLLPILIGSVFTWRHFTVWRRRRNQGGLELIGTERELEGLYPDAR